MMNYETHCGSGDSGSGDRRHTNNLVDVRMRIENSTIAEEEHSMDAVTISTSSYHGSDSSECDYSSIYSTQESSIIEDIIKQQHENKSPSLQIIGLYGRAPKPNEHLSPENYTEQDYMPRRRLKTDNVTNNNNNNNNKVTFVPVRGLVNETFWHIQSYNEMGLFDDRAILFQAREHYEKIAKEPQFISSSSSSSSSVANFQNGNYLNSPYFGEQVIVQGMDSSQLAVGDVFEVEGKVSSLVVEIASPRKPCYHVDKKNGTPLGLNGMKRYNLSNGLAGWFTRVLVGGELREGMKLVRTKHPFPKWTLTYLSQVLYTEGTKSDMLASKASWSRSKEELIELVNLKPLGEYEWKREARKLLKELMTKEKENASMLSRLWSKSFYKSPPLKIEVKGIYGRSWDYVRPTEFQRHGIMQRERYYMSHIKEPKGENDEEANFVPTRGLMYEKFWHSDDEKINGGSLHGDRAILFQDVEHYEALSNDKKFASCFDYGNYDYIMTPTFGEQVIVKGCDSSKIAVGDIFEVEDKTSPLIIEISSPRKARDFVDINHHGKVMGKEGIKQHCLTYGLAGWFARVLVGGTLRDGMKLVRIENPHPKWNIALVSNKMYKNGDIANWDGTEQELIELMTLSQLGNLHWKTEGMKLLETLIQNR